MAPNNDNRNRPPQGDGKKPVDFGSFVTSSVERSANKLKGAPTTGEPEAPQQAQPRQRQRMPGSNRTVERSRDSSYWRKRAAGTAGEVNQEPERPQQPRRSGNRYLEQKHEPDHDDYPDYDEDRAAAGGGFGGFGNFIDSVRSGDGDDGKRNRIIALVAALVILALLIFGLMQLFGGDDDSGDGGDVTPVPTEVIGPPSTPDGPTDLTGDPTEPPEGDATEEPTIPRGGDNQRGEEDSGPDIRPTDAATAIALSNEVALACQGHCLIRMEGPNQQDALDAAKARISWGEGDLSWLVVTPEQAEILSRTHTITMILADEPETYMLYAVKAPESENRREIVDPHGTVLDLVGRYYLVQWHGTPAIVKPVTDWGYAVFKLAPRQPESIAVPGSLGAAEDFSAWDMNAQIDPARVEATVNTLTRIGPLDGNEWGTRYYMYPGNQIAADYLFQELESYGFKVWYEDFIMWDGYLLVNVVAQIDGTDTTEVYALMAHFDTNNLIDKRFAPGADDNASGLATVLEVARVLSQYTLTNSLQIAFVNAEEEGIIGSNHWARNAVRTGVPIQGVLNVDSVGSVRNRPYIVTNSDGNSSWMQQQMTRVNGEYDLQETLQHHQTDKIVADDNFVRSEGIPAIMIARELYESNSIHHTHNDIPENVSIPGVVDTVRIVLIMTWENTK